MAKEIVVEGEPPVVSVNPHVHTGESIRSTMLDVIIALTPAALVGIYSFGLRGALLIAVSVLAAVVTEEVCTRMRGVPSTIGDLSAALTGLFLALVCPVNMPLWMAVVGCVFSIAISKQIYGGVGRNIYNPALVGRAYLLVAYPAALTTWIGLDKLSATIGWASLTYPLTDAVTTATPLGVLRETYFRAGDFVGAAEYCSSNMLSAILGVGGEPGSLGETSVVALLIGAVLLLRKAHITWHIPVGTLLGMYVTGLFVYGTPLMGPAWTISFYGLWAGGAVLGAFYMATDMVTSPVTQSGRFYFGLGCGILTVLIRRYGAYPEGMSFAILLMNNVTPLIDYYTLPLVFGQTERKKG